jgi:hypothetical protein
MPALLEQLADALDVERDDARHETLAVRLSSPR